MASLLPAQSGSFRLFRIMGIEVSVHWLWFLAAVWELSSASQRYSSLVWNVVEYLSLFAIVLLHEFGHALACRSVGGKADRIVLWLLGGVAFVAPPRRPGATLWSIAAGPLVNVALLPILIALYQFGRAMGWPQSHPDLAMLVRNLCFIDFGLLVFNMLPVYPLDGGQILQSLLWFALGEARSLMVVSVVGMVGMAGLFMLAIAYNAANKWLLITAFFVASSCWRGLTRARALGKIAEAPKREGFHCPACQAAPPVGQFWRCSRCKSLCDTFSESGACPGCGAPIGVSVCVRCGAMSPLDAWRDGYIGPQDPKLVP